MLMSEDAYLAHYGILRKSGRYPWGSGDNPESRSRDFLGTINAMKTKGLSESDIAEGLDLRKDNGKLWNTTDFRAAKSIARTQTKQADIRMAQRLKDKGLSNVEIGKRMGGVSGPLNESSVRSLLDPGAQNKVDITNATTNMLRDQIKSKQFVDVGAGVENQLSITDTKLKIAIASLKEEGYGLHYPKVLQQGTGKYTTFKVMTPPGIHTREVYQNIDKIRQITDFSPDGGHTFSSLQPPIQVSAGRVAVNYHETGGSKLDGVIYVRPGVDDLTLGRGNYAQVRIAVGGTHYLKGMAMYKNDLPEGVDLLFNTNKSDTGNKLDAMKKQTDDANNPFGSMVRQLPKLDKSGDIIPNTVRSAMNIVHEEGDWATWNNSLSTQFLSKQSPVLARTQLAMAFEQRKTELDEINSLTNPAVKRKLLDEFSDKADSAATQLKAASLPRQSTRVILPIDSLKDNEVYAPTFRNGERVVLIRHPHGGPFEIPELVVNNSSPEAKSLLGKAEDAIGINARVAERLSGADFDGDQVLVIPNNSNRVKSAPALEGLQNFDPKRDYAPYDGMRTIDGGTYNAKTREVDYVDKKSSRKQNEMGNISNLITDMSIQKANSTELAAAVRHSMVVIDAEKHHLDVKASYVDNNIKNLKVKYQGLTNGRPGGSSTLISRATSEKRVPERKQGFTTNPVTGEKIYRETGATYEKNGKTIIRTEKSTKLGETTDAHTLSSGTPIEKIYADYSNSVKALANEARLASLRTPNLVRSPSAAKTYEAEVKSLTAKLEIAKQNRPRERQAQVVAAVLLEQKKTANPDMDKETERKARAQSLTDARLRVGARKKPVEITDEEWEAIQHGAISNSRLKSILDNTDVDKVRERATPRANVVMTSLKYERAKQMIDDGYTQAQVADALGVNVSTLQKSLKRGDDNE